MKHILLIEPDYVLAKTTSQYLVAQNYAVSHCADAQSAVALADDNPPDVVVLELQLAAHSGIEFIYEFRSYTDWANVPIIVLSSLAGSEVIAEEAYRRQFFITHVLKKSNTSLPQLGRAIADSLTAKITQVKA